MGRGEDRGSSMRRGRKGCRGGKRGGVFKVEDGGKWRERRSGRYGRRKGHRESRRKKKRRNKRSRRRRQRKDAALALHSCARFMGTCLCLGQHLRLIRIKREVIIFCRCEWVDGIPSARLCVWKAPRGWFGPSPRCECSCISWHHDVTPVHDPRLYTLIAAPGTMAPTDAGRYSGWQVSFVCVCVCVCVFVYLSVCVCARM